MSYELVSMYLRPETNNSSLNKAFWDSGQGSLFWDYPSHSETTSPLTEGAGHASQVSEGKCSSFSLVPCLHGTEIDAAFCATGIVPEPWNIIICTYQVLSAHRSEKG